MLLIRDLNGPAHIADEKVIGDTVSYCGETLCGADSINPAAHIPVDEICYACRVRYTRRSAAPWLRRCADALYHSHS